MAGEGVWPEMLLWDSIGQRVHDNRIICHAGLVKLVASNIDKQI